MPTNLDALLRYHTIDRCLQNRFRKWTWKDLSDACFLALDELRYRSNKVGVSQRTIENDIKVMRSNQLGYNAPIVREKGCYRYSDPHYSIKNASLLPQDIFAISLASKILGHYKGFPLQHDLDELINRVESKLQVAEFDKAKNIVAFEELPASKGQEYLAPFAQAITDGVVLRLEYQRFDKPKPWPHILHPYLLKEYRNRWYLLGYNPKVEKITTYALDRITSFAYLSDHEYLPNTQLDPERYFRDTIGITFTGDEPVHLRLLVKDTFVPYIETQPLHASQKKLKEGKDGWEYAFRLVDNPELRTLLSGFGDLVEVLQPEYLRQVMKERLQAALNRYTDKA